MSITVKGHRVLLNRPKREERLIQLTPEMEEEMNMRELANLKRLEVYAIGKDVTEVAVGDVVYVNLMYLQSAELVEIEGEEKIMIRDSDIAFTW
jgi:co-chaperonin GroES (HSP10)